MKKGSKPLDGCFSSVHDLNPNGQKNNLRLSKK